MSLKTFWEVVPLLAALSLPAAAADVLTPGTAKLDHPTLIALGIQLPVTGDDNFNASVTVEYRAQGTLRWREGLPLYRVHPEVVTGRTVPPQFAGSIFDLRPGTTYEIRLHIVDPDGLDQTQELTATTRPVPGDPATPRLVNVTDAAGFRAALGAAQAGDVIVLADGQYAGPFVLNRSGTSENPIVIRGASQDGVILDGANCGGCNIVEIYGSHTHLENLTIRNGFRAIRFQNTPTTGNVARRLHITDTNLGIGSVRGQSDFYIADNILEGRLKWPSIYSDDNGAHSDDTGIRVTGHGHVVAHNRISGFGDAMITDEEGARGLDFYGNDILWTYDNGVEMDTSEGNVRVMRNRFTNTYATISAQPLFGGPGYILHNIVVNVAQEQLKFKSLNGNQPSGMLVYNNTFVSPTMSLNLQTGATSHYFVIANNLFVGPDPVTQPNGYTVDWGAPNDHGIFDYNGYTPDGKFGYGQPGGGYKTYQSFAEMREQSGMETHGLLLEKRCPNGSPFAGCLAAPDSYKTQLPPPNPRDLVLLKPAPAVLRLPNVNTDREVNGEDRGRPDLGAIQAECRNAPQYGPRPAGIDERNQRFGCFEEPRDALDRSRRPEGVMPGLRSLLQ